MQHIKKSDLLTICDSGSKDDTLALCYNKPEEDYFEPLGAGGNKLRM